MPIIRCSDQKLITLEEFYTELSDTSTNQYGDVGSKMLEFLDFGRNSIFALNPQTP